MKKCDLKKILVPIDFSAASERSIETARQLAQRFGAAIHLVHVHEFWDPVGLMTPSAPVPMSMSTFRQEDADRIREQLGMLARKHEIPLTICYLRNDIPVFNGVCKVARQIDADLIVMQTHGYTGMKRFFEGSSAERIVQHSSCPVLIARKRRRKASAIPPGTKGKGSVDSILVPVDFSQPSLEALEYAIQFAERVAARLIVFHAVHLGYAFTADGYGMRNLSVLVEETRKSAEEQMQQFVRRVKFRGVEFETVLKIAPPASEICEFAEQRDVDLIITATHGRTGLKHLLMGSVAEQVVRRARQPVLVVPSHPETRKARLTPAKRSDQQSMTQSGNRPTIPNSTGRLTKRNRKLAEHPSPERRQTNKFRESHLRRAT